MKTIKWAAEYVGISAYAIRYYEKEGLLDIPRNEQGIRVFDDESLFKLIGIKHYRNVGMTLKDIKKIFDSFYDHDLSVDLLEDRLKEVESSIDDLINTKEYLKMKIEFHKRLSEF